MEPLELSLALLAQVDGGVIRGKASKGAEIFWFEPPVKGYQTINVWGDDYSFSERSHVSNPQLDSFVERWVVLCEQGKADFGYFGRYMQMVEKRTVGHNLFVPVKGPLGKKCRIMAREAIYRRGSVRYPTSPGFQPYLIMRLSDIKDGVIFPIGLGMLDFFC